MLTPAGAAELPIVDEVCSDDVLAHFADTDSDQLLQPIGSNDAWTALLTANNPGQAPSSAPILMIHGTNDFLPVHAVQHLHEQMCTIGQHVELRIIDGGDHNTSWLPAYTDGAEWITQRLQGGEARNSCPP